MKIGGSIQPTTDGGYVVAGQAISNNDDVGLNHGATDAWGDKAKALMSQST